MLPMSLRVPCVTIRSMISVRMFCSASLFVGANLLPKHKKLRVPSRLRGEHMPKPLKKPKKPRHCCRGLVIMGAVRLLRSREPFGSERRGKNVIGQSSPEDHTAGQPVRTPEQPVHRACAISLAPEPGRSPLSEHSGTRYKEPVWQPVCSP